MEDIRIGRETGSLTRTVSVGLGATVVLAQPDPNRIALIIGLPGTATANIGPQGIVPTATIGIAVNANIGPLMLSLDNFGVEVTKQFQIFCAAATIVTVTEVSLEKR